MFDENCKLCGLFMTKENQEEITDGGIICVPTMHDSLRFEYGLAGTYEFKKDMGLKEGDSFCNACLLKHNDDFHPYMNVKCSVCGFVHQALDCCDDNYKPGWNCAADVSVRDGKLFLHAGFGSRHDCDLYEVNCDLKVGILVCDDCIDKMEQEGKLKFVSNGIPGRRENDVPLSDVIELLK
jgi:hypothetical protein